MLNQDQSVPLSTLSTIQLEVNPTRRKRADAVANRKLVLETAQKLFREQGIENVSMTEIARAAGVGKGTLYRAVANKGELCFALMDEDLRAFQDQIFRQLQQMHAATAVEQLMMFLDRAVRFFEVHSVLILEAQTHGLSLSNRREVNQTSLHGWFHHTVTVLVQRGQREGAVSAESDPAYLADMILAPLNPTLFRHQRWGVGLSLDEMSAGLRRFVLSGIASN